MQEKVRMANAQQFWLLPPGLGSLGRHKPSLFHFLNCFGSLSRYVLNNWNWAFVAPSYISRYGCHQLFSVLDVPISAGWFLAYLCSWYQLTWYKITFVLDVPISSGWFLALANLPLLCPMAQTHQKNNNNDNSTVNMNGNSYNNKNLNDNTHSNSNMYHIQRSNPLAALIASLQPLR